MKVTLRTVLRYSLITVVVLVLAGYVFYVSRPYLNGPVIHISSPENGASFENALIHIEGTARNVSELLINDTASTISPSGEFSYPLTLLSGYNKITIEACDRFGRTRTSVLDLYLSEDELTQDELSSLLVAPLPEDTDEERATSSTDTEE